VRNATERALIGTAEEMGDAAREYRRDRAVMERACEILTAWHWASIARRRHVIHSDEVDAVERRHQDLIRAVDAFPSMCRLTEALRSPSALGREAILLALSEA